jgi:hypothetical protein
MKSSWFQLLEQTQSKYGWKANEKNQQKNCLAEHKIVFLVAEHFVAERWLCLHLICFVHVVIVIR